MVEMTQCLSLPQSQPSTSTSTRDDPVPKPAPELKPLELTDPGSWTWTWTDPISHRPLTHKHIIRHQLTFTLAPRQMDLPFKMESRSNPWLHNRGTYIYIYVPLLCNHGLDLDSILKGKSICLGASVNVSWWRIICLWVSGRWLIGSVQVQVQDPGSVSSNGLSSGAGLGTGSSLVLVLVLGWLWGKLRHWVISTIATVIHFTQR